MAVYKDGILYDLSYQVDTGSEPIAKPNTFENLTKGDPSRFPINVDNTWLPYLGTSNGSYLIGSAPINGLWGYTNSIWLEPTLYPVAVTQSWANFGNVNQIYINNKSPFGVNMDPNVGLEAEKTKYFTVIDENENIMGGLMSSGRFGASHPEGGVIMWAPNSSLYYGNNGYPSYYHAFDVINAGTIGQIGDGTGWTKPETIYINESLYNELQSNSNWMQYFNSSAVTYNPSETQWLDDYFIIEQDGQTLPWFTDSIKNVFGKYIRLKDEGSIVAELPYWETDVVTAAIEPNSSTSASVTRTGSITYGQITKNYSITLGPKATVMEKYQYYEYDSDNGYNFINLSPMWKWDYMQDYYDNWGVAATIDLFNSIDVTVTDSNGTSVTVNKPVLTMSNYENYRSYLIWQFFNFELTGTDTYHIKYYFNPDKFKEKNATRFENRILRSNSNGEVWDVRDTSQYYATMKGAWMDSYFFDNSFAPTFYFTGWDVTDAGYTTITVKNTHTTEVISGYRTIENFVYENCTTNGAAILTEPTITNYFYVNSTRLPFNGPLGIEGGANITNIYLPSNIYAMTNHGFDDTAYGWSIDAYNAFVDRGTNFIELPQNWQSLIPYYI